MESGLPLDERSRTAVAEIPDCMYGSRFPTMFLCRRVGHPMSATGEFCAFAQISDENLQRAFRELSGLSRVSKRAGASDRPSIRR